MSLRQKIEDWWNADECSDEIFEIIEEVAALEKELGEVRLMYDQLCIECREYDRARTPPEVQHRIAQIKDHVRRYEERKAAANQESDAND